MTLRDTRAIVTCVDYWDMLDLTLPHNIEIFKSVLVLTTRADVKTVEVAQRHGADVLLTDVFYDREAVFNKFAAIEQGLDFIGRNGWLCLLDADLAMSNRTDRWKRKVGEFYTPRRRLFRAFHRNQPAVPDSVPEERTWAQFNTGAIDSLNYCQIFHGNDPVLLKKPWHQVDWTWASGANSMLCDKWFPKHRPIPPFDVLHFGQTGVNWAGRVSPYRDGTVDPRAETRRGIFQNLMNFRKADIRQNRNRRCDERYAMEKLLRKEPG